MPSIAEIARGLRGAWRLLRLDAPGGLACFDGTPLGAARSFWAAAVTLPLFLALLLIATPAESWSQTGVAQILGVNLISYVIGWTLLPVIVYQLAHWLGRGDRFWLYLCAANWSNVIQFILSSVAQGIAAFFEFDQGVPAGGALLFAGVAALFALALSLGVIAYSWYVIRVSLDAGWAATTAIVLIDLVSGIALSHVTKVLT